MARNLNLKSLSVLTILSTLGAAHAQAYLSVDNLFCCPSYDMASPLSFARGGGASAGKITFNPFSITRRVAPPTGSSTQLCDFDFSCVMSWSWGETNSGTQPIKGGGSGRCTMSITRAGTLSDGTELFDTELVSMDASATGTDGSVMRLRESPTKASKGSWDLAPGKKVIAPHSFIAGGGPYEITSFIDLNADASVDNGQTWTSSSASSRMQGTPEPASIAAMGVGAFGLLRRRKKQA